MGTTSRISLAFSLLIAVLLVSSSGCRMPKASKIFSLDNAWPWGDDEPEVEVPVRVVGTWVDTTLRQPGQTPQRGFGGRLVFYDEEGDKPVLVDGQLVVYAFDEHGREPTDNKPTRRYVFPADVIPRHMSETDIGPSYSFWLPWDDAGGPKTEVSLICRFEPKDGSVVTGEQTKHVLPGGLPSEATAQHPPKLPEGVPSRPAQTTLQDLQSSRQAQSGAQLANYELVVAPSPQVAAGVTRQRPRPTVASDA